MAHIKYNLYFEDVIPSFKKQSVVFKKSNTATKYILTKIS